MVCSETVLDLEETCCRGEGWRGQEIRIYLFILLFLERGELGFF